ncbi:MAG: HAD family hydrolase [SAR202 cluster bacterium]|nr:HAD family hydrolase [SAR202 cluster bacterium]|tara:strand:+ start:2077 stop:2802 length:726 start_codon:yes stop_codon:yes gene_type:complete
MVNGTIKGIVFDDEYTLMEPYPASDLMAEIRVRVIPLLVDNAPPGGLLPLAERVLRHITAELEADTSQISNQSNDLASSIKTVFDKEKIWVPEGLLEESLGLSDGKLAEYLYERKSLSQEARRTLRDLRRKGFFLGLVANSQFKRDWLKTIPLYNPDDDLFDTVILSCDVGFRKPDPRIFHAVYNSLKLNSHEVAYVTNDLESVPLDIAEKIILTSEFRKPNHQPEAIPVIENISDLVGLM